MLYVEIVHENLTRKIPWEFETQMDHTIQDLVLISKKKRTYIVDFAVPADHKVKVKEVEQLYKYKNLGRELNKSSGTWK